MTCPRKNGVGLSVPIFLPQEGTKSISTAIPHAYVSTQTIHNQRLAELTVSKRAISVQ